MRNTISQQTAAVRDILASERCHLTAEEIIARLPSCCTATVYRSLEQLTSLGIIRKLSIPNRKAVYEYSRDPHTHLMCTACARISDLPLDLSGLIGEAARLDGFTVKWSDATAYGLCRECAGLAKSTEQIEGGISNG